MCKVKSRGGRNNIRKSPKSDKEILAQKLNSIASQQLPESFNHPIDLRRVSHLSNELLTKYLYEFAEVYHTGVFQDTYKVSEKQFSRAFHAIL